MPKIKCPNPLFEKWLEEWKEEACKRDDMYQFCFTKALASLRKYPCRLNSGKDCMILTHFGKKLCEMLDKKLNEHIQLHGNPCAQEGVVPKKKRKVVNKPYVPQIGSGAYALLRTLYENSQNPHTEDFMWRNDLMEQAQKYSDTRMKGNALEHYGAWAGMTTLIQKFLVIKRSSPAKYSLTDTGFALALSLHESSQNGADGFNNDIAQSNVSQKYNNVQKSSEAVKSSKKRAKKAKPGSSKAKDDSVMPRNNNWTNVDDEVFEDFTEPQPDRFMNNENKSSPQTGLNSNDVFVDINDDQNNLQEMLELQQAIELSKIEYENRNNDVEVNGYYSASQSSFHEFCEENPEPVISVKKKSTHFLFTEDTEVMDLENSHVPSYKDQTTRNLDDVYSIQSAAYSDAQTNFDPPPQYYNDIFKPAEVVSSPTKKSNEFLNSVEQPAALVNNSQKSKMKKISSNEETDSQTFYLLPNNFDIILLVDTQESPGAKTKSKHATIEELNKHNTTFEIRNLNVGDFTWVARCRFTNKELVLPYIIERKRIDDFSSSIQDSRYQEQKFRLRKCGLKNVIYMVENYGKNYHGAIPLTSLYQAAVNSCVQDSFTVKFTKDHKDSMAYISSLTEMLIKIFEGKELVRFTKEKIEEEGLEKPDGAIRLMEFAEFNKSSIKTKKYNVREMFIKQLLQLKGLSVEKAVAITEMYPTPKLLSEAFREADEKLLADKVAGSSNRKIGPAISKTLHQFYTKYSFSCDVL